MKHLTFNKCSTRPCSRQHQRSWGFNAIMTRRKLGFLAAALGGLALALPLPAAICHGMCASFGLLDIAAGDTLRLNVVMPPHARAGTCILQAAIIQPTAGPCFECTLASSTITLSPGQSGALEYAGAFPVRALPQVIPAGRPNTNCDQVTASVEVYDTVSRRTRLINSSTRLSPPERDEIPTGPPNYPSAGLTSASKALISTFTAFIS